jgi:Zn-dependent M28 family amino/carboxypeptidase
MVSAMAVARFLAPTLAALVLSCAAPARPVAETPAPTPADPAPVVAADSPPVQAELQAKPATPIADAFRADAEKILAAGMEGRNAFAMLRQLTDHVGHRAAGSPGYTAAVAWGKTQMAAVGLDRIRTDGTRVRVWNRGTIDAEVVAPARHRLDVLALGNSPATPKGGLTAELLVIQEYEELEKLGEQGVKGRIVLFAHAMPAYVPGGDVGYAKSSHFRTRGPARASKLGARAVLVRSATAKSLATPHTGVTLFDEKEKAGPPVPAAAISIEGAELLVRLASEGPVKLKLSITSSTGPMVAAPNVIGEIVGRERPEEIVLLGAHLDSWDVGQGAHDDGAGCAIMLEAVGILKRLGLQPRRTIRVVLFSNEERGLDGSVQYAKDHPPASHVAAIESDGGGGAPVGLSFEGKEDAPAYRRTVDLIQLFAPFGATRLITGYSGSDLKHLTEVVPRFGHAADISTYFDVHHTAADTLDKVNPDHLQQNAALMAVWAWVVAEMPARIGDPL